MRRISLLLGMLAALVGALQAAHVWAFPESARQTKLACVTCHSNPAGGSELKAAGTAYKADMTKVPAADTARAAVYVGVNKCKTCHPKQYKAWLQTKHSKALVNLQKANPMVTADVAVKLKIELKDPAAQTEGCVSCHVTAFHLKGGFPAADSAKTAVVSNVTCEACHGPGSLHVSVPTAQKKKFINKRVTAKMCTQCHTPALSPAFEFVDYAKRGVHAVPATKTGG